MVFHSLSLPANIVEKLKLVKDNYEDVYRRRVSYGEIFERLLSPMGLGSVDPAVYEIYQDALKSRAEFDEVVKRTTKKHVDELVERAKENGTSLSEEALKEQEQVVANMKAAKAEYDALTDEQKCQRILDMWAEVKKPQSEFWTGFWMVRHDGLIFALLKGKYGRSDYADIDLPGQEALKIKTRYLSEKDLLDKGFLKFEHPEGK